MSDRTCSIDGCTGNFYARRWCAKHYQRWLANGDPRISRRRIDQQLPACIESGCDKPPRVRDRCARHYRQWQLSQRGPCSVDGCDTPWSARGLCQTHNSRLRRTGSTDGPPSKLQCRVEDCDHMSYARGFCRRHHANWARHGDPVPAIIVGNDEARRLAYTDDSGGPDACWPWTGNVLGNGYGQAWYGKKVRAAHIVAWEIANSASVPPGMHLDHVCHNRAWHAGRCRPPAASECLHRRCVNPAHLVPKTPMQHYVDSPPKGNVRGSAHGIAKLAEVQVLEIVALRAAGETQASVALRFRVGRSTIGDIERGVTWGHLTGISAA